jgi:hypothetical protein
MSVVDLHDLSGRTAPLDLVQEAWLHHFTWFLLLISFSAEILLIPYFYC